MQFQRMVTRAKLCVLSLYFKYMNFIFVIMLQEVLVLDNYCATHCMVKGINWDDTIVIGDNDNDSLNSHMDIEQL